MYNKTLRFKNYSGKDRSVDIQLNLDERDVFKLLTEFKIIFDWQESMKGPARELPTEEVVDFYTAFEDVLLASYGVVMDDGDRFDRSGVYAFKQSAACNQLMVMCLEDPAETGRLITAIMPEGLEKLVRKAAENAEALENGEDTPEAIKAELARLRAEAAKRELESQAPSASA